MFEKIRFVILCVTSGLAMAAAAETPGHNLTVRLYFNFEGQEFCLSVAGDRVEALTIHHGRVQRRGIGKVSPEFSAALKAVQEARLSAVHGEVEGREVIANERFYYIALPDGVFTSALKNSPSEIERLLTAGRH